MKKEDFNTSMLYYGFPVIILGYKDEKFGYNITTISSSYSMGEMVVIGCWGENNVVKQIKRFKEFTINVPDRNLMKEIEIAGFSSGTNKLKESKLEYSLGAYADAPIIDKCILTLECKVESIVEFNSYVNFIASVKRRIVNENLIQDGKLKSELFNPVIYAGDENSVLYRYLSDEYNNTGDFTDFSKFSQE